MHKFTIFTTIKELKFTDICNFRLYATANNISTTNEKGWLKHSSLTICLSYTTNTNYLEIKTLTLHKNGLSYN